ncbi:hypothetical protein [Rhizobium sp. L43]|uniref:hypothetical protein n=1 Tax=Rhizobium sp. L43 TaxID=2035452 RepID=UPI001179ED43|nr:hypothetical protein [Rhizobium sp. L43]
MMRRTMVLTLRQARVWKPQQSSVLEGEFRFPVDDHPPSAGTDRRLKASTVGSFGLSARETGGCMA